MLSFLIHMYTNHRNQRIGVMKIKNHFLSKLIAQKKYCLLVFAHFQEASAFFDYLETHWYRPELYTKNNLKSSDEQSHLNNLSLYQCPGFYILISGEGPWKTQESLTKFSLLFHEKLSNLIQIIFNIGVCGSLVSEQEEILLKEQSCHWINLVSLAYPKGHMEFQTHLSYQFNEQETTVALKNKVNLVTSFERILNEEDRQKLSLYGDLVDRECWSVGQIAKTWNIPFVALKMISDTANSEDFCKQVKDAAAWSSQRLAECFFQEFSLPTQGLEQEITLNNFENEKGELSFWQLFLQEHRQNQTLYATFQQQKKWQQLSTKLEKIYGPDIVEWFKEQDLVSSKTPVTVKQAKDKMKILNGI